MTIAVARNFGLFAITVFIAWLQHWQAVDIAWSMWISSLVTGYAWIVVTIVTSGHQLMHGETFEGRVPADMYRPPLIALIPFGLFLLAFFTVHFGGFHFGHAQFLKIFFPIPGIDEDTSFPDIIIVSLTLYWPFVAVSIFDRSVALTRSVREGKTFNIFAPYAAVVKNHIMIIFIGFSALLIKQEQVLWLLLIFYFFPYGDFFRDRKNENPFQDTLPPPAESTM